jgi:arylsulfatase A-like enzyme
VKKLSLYCLLTLSFASPLFAAGKAKHIVVIVWDGLRPDSINERDTPTLHKLARDGVFFQNHHAVYLSSTEVNGVAMATGAYPARNGVLANREYRPGINPLKRTEIESPDAIRKGDELTGGHYLKLPTLAELLRKAGLKVAIAGAKPIVTLHDRSHAVTVKQPDGAATRALLAEWDDGVPAFSVLWLSEPDATQHNTGPGSAKSREALRGSDRNLALVLDELDAKRARKQTDIFVVSDHGFSTITRTVDVAGELKKAGFGAYREFKQPPAAGDVMVVGNGGSVLLYVIGRDKSLVQKIVEFLQQQDWPGVLFTREPMTGTFTLDQARLNTADAPDIVVSLRWSDEKNDAGIAGGLVSDGVSRVPGQGNHASLSRYDMRATLVAAGADFRRGMVDQLPSGNADLAPTILWLLNIPQPAEMDGRVLVEAAVHGADARTFPAIETHTLERAYDSQRFVWKQYLHVTEFAGAIYFDEGNGAMLPK